MQIKASDIRLVLDTVEWPEQYTAFDREWNPIGYIRVKRSMCEVWCPDAGSDDLVYSAELDVGYMGFGSSEERDKHLKLARESISEWCNKHPGVYGEYEL